MVGERQRVTFDKVGMTELATALVILATLPTTSTPVAAPQFVGPTGAPVRDATDLVLPLSRGWREDPGEEPDPRPGGDYKSIVELPGGGTCALRISASARTGGAAPTLRGGRLRSASGGFRIERSGRRAGGRWYAGRSPGRHWAVATLGATVVELSLEREAERFGAPGPDGFPPLQVTERDGRLCGVAHEATARGELRRAVRRARIGPVR